MYCSVRTSFTCAESSTRKLARFYFSFRLTSKTTSDSRSREACSGARNRRQA